MIDAGDATGTVEDVGLRITRVRDENGVVERSEGAIIRVSLKTLPLRQPDVLAELRARLSAEFAREGMRISLPEDPGERPAAGSEPDR